MSIFCMYVLYAKMLSDGCVDSLRDQCGSGPVNGLGTMSKASGWRGGETGINPLKSLHSFTPLF